jgi:hypothetical protein
MEMLNRKSALMACGAIILGFSMSSSAAAHARMLGSRNALTFSGPVALPGVTLSAGTYTFEVLNSESGGGLVRVLDKSRTRIYLTAITLPISRPAGMPKDAWISFGEAPKGAARPIRAWFPDRGTLGHEFIYDRH